MIWCSLGSVACGSLTAGCVGALVVSGGASVTTLVAFLASSPGWSQPPTCGSLASNNCLNHTRICPAGFFGSISSPCWYGSIVGMLSVSAQKLFHGVLHGNVDAVKAVLESGVDVNGSPEEPLELIAAAAFVDDADMVQFLLEQGADPDKPVGTLELTHTCPYSGTEESTIPGEQALHIATRGGNVEIVRLLLERARADPNATSSTGFTPLMETVVDPNECRVEVMRLLLEAGADPALANENGLIPLHAVAIHGNTDLVDMLYSKAPATLHRCNPEGQTPLYLACYNGHESMVSKLLSLGAMRREPPRELAMCPLMLAMSKGLMGVVRVLMDGGVGAIGGGRSVGMALCMAAPCRQARILRLLLTVDGEEGRSMWANTSFGGRSVLHAGAGYCYPAAVSILLEAGADETVRDSEGRTARDVIGLFIDRDGNKVLRDQGGEVAIRRMLERGPAYRARSWAWPCDEKADTGGSGDGDTAAAAVAVLSAAPAMKNPPVVGVRVFRPKEKSNGKLFARLVGRYCAKN